MSQIEPACFGKALCPPATFWQEQAPVPGLRLLCPSLLTIPLIPLDLNVLCNLHSLLVFAGAASTGNSRRDLRKIMRELEDEREHILTTTRKDEDIGKV